jgi:hypothetical protein
MDDAMNRKLYTQTFKIYWWKEVTQDFFWPQIRNKIPTISKKIVENLCFVGHIVIDVGRY